MRMNSIATGLVALAIMAPSAQAAEIVRRDNPLRKVLLDAVRPAVEDDVGVPVQFVVDVLQVEGRWAYLAGTAQQKDGSPIDFDGTQFAEAIEEGMFDGPTVKALLQKSGKSWRVTAYNIGATDVVEAGWPDEFGVPCSVVNFC